MEKRGSGYIVALTSPAGGIKYLVNIYVDRVQGIARVFAYSKGQLRFFKEEVIAECSGDFNRIAIWLERTGCLALISPNRLSDYSLLKARWLECEAILFFDLGIEFQPLQDNRMNSFLQLCLDERRYSQ